MVDRFLSGSLMLFHRSDKIVSAMTLSFTAVLLTAQLYIFTWSHLFTEYLCASSVDIMLAQPREKLQYWLTYELFKVLAASKPIPLPLSE